jgi:hypothetical protein
MKIMNTIGLNDGHGEQKRQRMTLVEQGSHVLFCNESRKSGMDQGSDFECEFRARRIRVYQKLLLASFSFVTSLVPEATGVLQALSLVA